MFLLNKDMSFFDDVCEVCKFPKVDSEFTCKGCKSVGQRGRPANHDEPSDAGSDVAPVKTLTWMLF